MWRGALAGTLVLIVVYVVVQPGASSKAGEASNAFQTGLKRLFSPQVAGIGNHSGAAETAPKPTATAVTSGPFYTI